MNKIWFDQGYIHLLMEDGRSGNLPVRLFPRLYNATEAQRNAYTFSPCGIHWPEIDEDLSFDGFFNNEFQKRPRNSISQMFHQYPELNLRQFARSAGLNPSLLQQYIDGYKTPSDVRIRHIEDSLHRLGRELVGITLSKDPEV